MTYLAVRGTQSVIFSYALQVNSPGSHNVGGMWRSGILQGSSSDLSPQSSTLLQRRCLSMQRPLLQENDLDPHVTKAEKNKIGKVDSWSSLKFQRCSSHHNTGDASTATTEINATVLSKVICNNLIQGKCFNNVRQQ